MALYKNITGKSATGTTYENHGINNYAHVTIPNSGHYKIVFGGTSSTGQIVVKISDDPNMSNYWDSASSSPLLSNRMAIKDYDVYLSGNTTIYCWGTTDSGTWRKVFLEVVPIE